MGKVISIRDFSSDVNIGIVKLRSDANFLGVHITGDNNIIGDDKAGQLTVEYIPSNTSKKGVRWSIVSGSEYADVDDNGNISIKEGANNNQVVVRAQSIVYEAVKDEVTIVVKYRVSDVELAYIETGGGNYVDTGIKPSELDYIGMTFNVTQTDKETALFGAQPTKFRYFNLSQQGGGKTLRMFDCLYLGGYMQMANIALGEHVIEYNLKTMVFKLDGEVIAKTGSASKANVTQNIYLFAINVNGTATAAPGSNGSGNMGIKSFKTMKDGIILCDMKAVLNDGKARFWDNVRMRHYDINGDNEVTYKP